MVLIICIILLKLSEIDTIKYIAFIFAKNNIPTYYCMFLIPFISQLVIFNMYLRDILFSKKFQWCVGVRWAHLWIEEKYCAYRWTNAQRLWTPQQLNDSNVHSFNKVFVTLLAFFACYRQSWIRKHVSHQTPVASCHCKLCH